MADSSNVAKRLFESVCIVDLQVPKPGAPSKQVTPALAYRWPAVDPNEKTKDPFTASLLQFAFPDIQRIKVTNSMTEERFSFILTDVSGQRRFGYCVRSLPDKSMYVGFPQAYCILGYAPFYEIFYKVLVLAQIRMKAGESHCNAFLEALFKHPLPPPGGNIELKIQSSVTNRLEQIKLARPADADRFLESRNMNLVLQKVSTQNLVSLFVSLLFERRVIFMSSNVGLLSECTQTILSLLYPLTWQHVLIPVLPTSLVSFCCAPMPFVLGLLAADWPELEKLRGAMEETIIFDLDKDRFVAQPFKDFDSLPSTYADLLLNGIKKVNPYHVSILSVLGKSNPSTQQLNQNIADVFLGFFVDLLQSYPDHMFALPTSTRMAFNKDGFVSSFRDEPTRQLIRKMSECQMFEQFIGEREESRELTTGTAFEQSVLILKKLQKTKLTANETEKAMIDTAISNVTKKDNSTGFFNKLKSHLI